MEEVKTAEQTLAAHMEWEKFADGPIMITASSVTKLMETFTSQQTASLRDSHKIELSNYAYQMDMAKRERDKAQEENKALREALEAIQNLPISGTGFINAQEVHDIATKAQLTQLSNGKQG